VDIPNLSEDEVIALLDDDSTPEEVVEQLAEHHFRFPAVTPSEPVTQSVTIDELAALMGTDTDKVLSHTKNAWVDGLAVLRDADLSDLRSDTVLDAFTATAIRATFDDIPNHSEATEGVMGALNKRAHRRRKKRFEDRRFHPSFGGVTLVAEGDSWFQHPYPGRMDVIQWLNERQDKYAIRCQSYAGDWIAQMREVLDTTLNLIEDVDAKAFLLSGGGNDMVGKPGIGHLFRKYKEGKPPSYYLGLAADRRLGELKRLYVDIIERVSARFPGLPILVHGYAHPFPGVNRHVSSGWAAWIQPSLEDDAGFKDMPKLQRAVVRLAMDRFNDMLEALADAYPNVHYIDCRKLVDRREHWVDELHPTDSRWKAVAEAFEDKLDAVL